MKKYLAGNWILGQLEVWTLIDYGLPYVAHDHGGDEQAWHGNTVTDLLHQVTRGTKSRRSDIRAAKVVHHDTDDRVDREDDRLAHQHRTREVLRLSHLLRDDEESRRPGVGKNDCCDTSHCLGEVWITNNLEV